VLYRQSVLSFLKFSNFVQIHFSFISFHLIHKVKTVLQRRILPCASIKQAKTVAAVLALAPWAMRQQIGTVKWGLVFYLVNI
jgi:hypothetical protein